MQRLILFLLLLSLGSFAFSQSASIKGIVKDENNEPLSYATVVLLVPGDSTLAYYGISSEAGLFEIKNIKTGKYILQSTLIGHLTTFRDISIPFGQDGNTGVIILKSTPVSLGEVIVSDEHVPMKFRQDTIEYNTAAFATRADAVVEDLLKKLPGIDVDRAGNIKAMGEDIKKVLVDGKEFFGNDTKLATRNVPADALKKVQVFDKRSDESEFTGIDDGTRSKTLNLLLKDEKKKGVFGELLGGAGNSGFCQGSAKVYKFTNQKQFAALGMLNNINQFGFSFRDYIDFNGGLESFGGHSGVQIKLPGSGGSTFPVNFGQPVAGLSTSGAGGLNYSNQFKKDSRVFMSYLANGTDRDLFETSSERNFTESDFFLQEDTLNEKKSDRAHRLNFGLRNRIDSTSNIIFNGNLSLSKGEIKSKSSSQLYDAYSPQSSLSAVKTDEASRLNGNLSGSYLKILKSGKSIFRLASNAAYVRNIAGTSWLNRTFFPSSGSYTFSNEYQDDLSGLKEISATSSFKVKIGRLLYLEPELKAGGQVETLDRAQGIPSDENIEIDSLSPAFEARYQWFRPEIRLIRNTNKMQFTLGMQAELGRTLNSLNEDASVRNGHFYFTPDLSWEYEYRTGRRLRANFMTLVNVPTVNQLLPSLNNINPMQLNYGNRYLKPELSYNMSLSWWIFDQFTFTSLLTDLRATYTKSKINWNKGIDENFMQFMTLMNVPDDYRISGSVSFSTPLRSLGLKLNADIDESWNKGYCVINLTQNVNTNLTHKIALSIENRKKTKLDAIIGGSFQVVNSKFTLQENLNNQYLELSYFTAIRYNPSKRWNFQFNAEVTSYNSQSYSDAVQIPLLGAEVSYYCLKNNRGTLSVAASDILNRNTGIVRTSEFNYLRETRSNMLGRLVMFSFKYQLNKFGNNSDRMDIKISR